MEAGSISRGASQCSLPKPLEVNMPDALRHWIWANLGWDIYDWHPEDVRF
jgi:hypothetical protein